MPVLKITFDKGHVVKDLVNAVHIFNALPTADSVLSNKHSAVSL